MNDVGEYPVPVEAHRVLVFGGTFDPPHRAHFALPLAARDAIGADWLLYVPAARSPLKTDGPIASDDDRIAMLRAGLRATDRASISTIELAHDSSEEGTRAPSYTVDTVARLKSIPPNGVELRLLIGADQAADFHRWREPRRIIELAEPAVMLRAPHASREVLMRRIRAHWTREEADCWEQRLVGVPLLNVSATRVRELLGAGSLDDAELRKALPDGVLDHIHARGLYSGK